MWSTKTAECWGENRIAPPEGLKWTAGGVGFSGTVPTACVFATKKGRTRTDTSVCVLLNQTQNSTGDRHACNPRF